VSSRARAAFLGPNTGRLAEPAWPRPSPTPPHPTRPSRHEVTAGLVTLEGSVGRMGSFEWRDSQFRGSRLGDMGRDYVPLDDGLESTDYDEVYDYPAKTDKDFAARVYAKIERDPERAAELLRRQNAAILELLQWCWDHRTELRDQSHEGIKSKADYSILQASHDRRMGEVRGATGSPSRGSAKSLSMAAAAIRAYSSACCKKRSPLKVSPDLFLLVSTGIRVARSTAGSR